MFWAVMLLLKILHWSCAIIALWLAQAKETDFFPDIPNLTSYDKMQSVTTILKHEDQTILMILTWQQLSKCRFNG